MSDILIRGMEMPKDCSTCPCFQYNMFDDEIDGYCKAFKTKITYSDERHPNCQLVEIKTPHGRLGDLNELKKKVLSWLPSDPCGREDLLTGRINLEDANEIDLNGNSITIEII